MPFCDKVTVLKYNFIIIVSTYAINLRVRRCYGPGPKHHHTDITKEQSGIMFANQNVRSFEVKSYDNVTGLYVMVHCVVRNNKIIVHKCKDL